MEQTVKNSNAEIVLSRIEQHYFKIDVILENHALVHIISGEMKITQADNSYTFTAGDTFLFPKNQIATVIKQSKNNSLYRSIIINIADEQVKKFYLGQEVKLDRPISKKIKLFSGHPLLKSLFASLIHYFNLSDSLPLHLSDLKITETISVLRVIDPGIDSLLVHFTEPGKVDLQQFMEQNYMFDVPIQKFSYLTGRSLSTFKRDFKKIFNTTPQKWLIQKRLELAHYKIVEKNVKPIDVFTQVGFVNLSHFSYIFKKQFGYSPNELIRSKAK